MKLEEFEKLIDENGIVEIDGDLYLDELPHKVGKKINRLLIHGDCSINGECTIDGYCSIIGNCWVYGNCIIHGDYIIRENCTITGDCSITGDYFINGNCKIGGDFYWSHMSKPDCKNIIVGGKILPLCWQRSYWEKRLGINTEDMHYDKILKSLVRPKLDEWLKLDKWSETERWIMESWKDK